LLLEKGANIRAKGDSRIIALYCTAALAGQEVVIQQLLEE
jgi:hypothetical protein